MGLKTVNTKQKDLIRAAILKPLPKDSLSTSDIITGMWSSTKLSVTLDDIKDIVNEMLIEELINAEVYMGNASDPDEVTEYRDERIADLIDEPLKKYRWYCATCGKLMLNTVNHYIPEDERYCECE